MTMNERQIGDSLLALTNALTERLGRHPALGPYLSVDETGKCSINIYADRINHYKCTDRATGDTFAEAIEAAWSIVDAIQFCDDEYKASSAVAKLKAENLRLQCEVASWRDSYEGVVTARDIALDLWEKSSAENHRLTELVVEANKLIPASFSAWRGVARAALNNTMGDE